MPEVTPTHTHTGLTSKRLLLLKITTLYDEKQVDTEFRTCQKETAATQNIEEKMKERERGNFLRGDPLGTLWFENLL